MGLFHNSIYEEVDEPDVWTMRDYIVEQLINEETTTPEIVDKYKCKNTTVYQLVKSYKRSKGIDFKIPSIQHHLNSSLLKLVPKLIERDNMDYKKLAETLGIGKAAASLLIHKHNKSKCNSHE